MMMNEDEFINHQISNKRKSPQESILVCVPQCFSCLACGDSI